MSTRYLIVLIGLIIIGGLIVFMLVKPESGSSVNSVPFIDDNSVVLDTNDDGPMQNNQADDTLNTIDGTPTHQNNTNSGGEIRSFTSSRQVRIAEEITLPLSGSVPTENVKHSIPIEEIRRGCFTQDCIPSVDNPVFVRVSEANDILPEDTIGIGLVYKGVERFYPFNMLVTREIVNETIAGDAILVTYCPLCGTGVVFERQVGGKVFEFGVSGMLWQSNLLMYNRASLLEDRNLWSQVLGEAVVGNDTGTKLAIIPSNVIRYTDWREDHPNSEILNTGRVGDPYGGNYYGVARSFAPNFDESDSPLDPSTYIFGVEVNGAFKAFPRDKLPTSAITEQVGELTLTVTKSDIDEISVVDSDGNNIPVVTGFWFSWIAAHPDTELWRN